MAKVIVDHTGACMGYSYTAGEVVDLPQDVISALGDSAQPAKESKTSKTETTTTDNTDTTENTDETKSLDSAPADKQVKSATRK